MTHDTRAAPRADEDPTLDALVHQLAEDIPALVRSEIRLAQAEVAEKGRQAGAGLGMFSAAGLLAFFGLATVITAAVIGLAAVLPTWASALVVAAALLLLAGMLALGGKNKVAESQPLKPERAVAGVQQDIETLKEIRP